MDQRTHFALAALHTDNFTALCRQFGISPKTGYKWQARLAAEGLAGLREGSRRPRHSPTALDEATLCRLIKIKDAHRTWGARKVQEVYRRAYGSPPSESTIKRVFQRCGWVEKRRSRPAAAGGRLTTAAPVTAPNDLWTVDFKGWWKEGCGRSNPLTVRDAFSRFILCVEHLDQGDTASVRAVFARLFRQYGLPRVIRSDNGPPFACAQAVLGLSQLSVWWLRLGIALDRSRPGCPQDNGGHERMHRDLQAEVAAVATERAVRSRAERAAHFAAWQQEFNHARPHEALAMKCPAEVYVRSPRPYRAEPPPFAYERMEVRRVHRSGYLSYGCQRYRLSRALAGQEVGLEVGRAGLVRVFFGPLCLGELDPAAHAFRAVPSHPPPAAPAEATPGGNGGARAGGALGRRSAGPRCRPERPPPAEEPPVSPQPLLDPTLTTS